MAWRLAFLSIYMVVRAGRDSYGIKRLPKAASSSWMALLPIIDNVLNSYLALCQSQPHCWGLLVPANFHEIVEDADDIQQFANHNRFVRAVAKPAATQVR